MYTYMVEYQITTCKVGIKVYWYQFEVHKTILAEVIKKKKTFMSLDLHLTSQQCKK